MLAGLLAIIGLYWHRTLVLYLFTARYIYTLALLLSALLQVCKTIPNTLGLNIVEKAGYKNYRQTTINPKPNPAKNTFLN